MLKPQKIHFRPLMAGLICFLSSLPSVAGAFDSCTFFTRADAEQLLNETVSEGIPSPATFPAGHSCRYTFSSNGNTYSLKLRISESAEIGKEGLYDSAADIMARQKRALTGSTFSAGSFVDRPTPGDDSFWNGTDLWLLKKGTLLIITVKAPLVGSFQNMAALNQAAATQNLQLSQAVAKTVLDRLND